MGSRGGVARDDTAEITGREEGNTPGNLACQRDIEGQIYVLPAQIRKGPILDIVTRSPDGWSGWPGR